MPHNMTQRQPIDALYFRERLERVLAGLTRYTSDELARELARMAFVASPDIAVKEMEARRGTPENATTRALWDGASASDGVSEATKDGQDQLDVAVMRDAVLMGLVKLGHKIDDDSVTIYRAKGDSQNALHQLTDAVLSTVMSVVDRFGTVPPVAWRWRPAAAETWTYMHGQPSEEQRTWLSKFGHSVEALFSRPKLIAWMAFDLGNTDIAAISPDGTAQPRARAAVMREATQ